MANSPTYYEKDFYKDLGDVLRQIRKSKSLTLKDVSEQIGITFKTLARYETGDHKIDVDTMKALCAYYGVSYVEVLNETKLYKKIRGQEEQFKDDIFDMVQDALELLLDDSKTPKYAGKLIDDKTRQQMISMLNMLNDVANINLFN